MVVHRKQVTSSCPPMTCSPTGAYIGPDGATKRPNSHTLLQGRHTVPLDDCLGGFGLHHHDLAENLSLARLRRRLHTRLDHEEPRDSDLAHLLDLSGGNGGQAVEDAHDILL